MYWRIPSASPPALAAKLASRPCRLKLPIIIRAKNAKDRIMLTRFLNLSREEIAAITAEIMLASTTGTSGENSTLMIPNTQPSGDRPPRTAYTTMPGTIMTQDTSSWDTVRETSLLASTARGFTGMDSSRS